MPDTPRAIALVTLGCKVNQYDSETIAEQLRAEGWLVVDRPADLPAGRGFVLVNSCTVTARAAAKSRQAARAAIRRNPEAKVILAGCYSQVSPAEAGRVDGLAGLAGTGRAGAIRLLRELAMGGDSGLLELAQPSGMPATIACAGLSLPPEFESLPAAPVRGRVRAFLKVEEGCEMNCAYCVVPLARGPQRSAPPEEAVASAASLLAQGAREIVLTGINLGAYSAGPTGGGLVGLIQRLLMLDGLRRLRLSSIEPTDVNESLLEVLASDSRICRHLHIPLQSGSDVVLRSMGRRYTAAEYLTVIERAKRALPGLAVSTDILVGLPGEAPADLAATERVVRAAAFMRLHVFPYSPRPGTRAATMPAQVSVAEREARATQLIEVGRELASTYHQQLVGRESEVLLERQPQAVPPVNGTPAAGYRNEGLTGDYVRAVVIATEPLPAGALVRVQIDAADDEGVAGKLVAPAR